MRVGRLALALAFAAVSFAFASNALAQQRAHTDVRFDAHLDFGWYHSAGVGFRVDIPIVQQGLVDGVDDDLSISPGAEAFWFYDNHHDGFGVFPILAFQWNFYVSPDWAVFPELGIAFLFGPERDRYWRAFAAPFIGVGARYHFSIRNALLFRINWPAGLQVGITF